MVAGIQRRESARDLVQVSLLALVGAAPLVFGPPGAGGAIALLVWLGLIALPVGWLAAGLGLRLWPCAWAIPCAWMIPLALSSASSAADPLSSAPWAALAWCGMFAAGFGAASFRRGGVWTGAAGLLALTALASGLLTIGGLVHGGSSGPFAPATGAHLLDLSPVVLVTESAGLDWMRHPSVYRTGGTAHMGPGVRTAWQGYLAGPGAFLFGCLVLVLGRRRPRGQTLHASSDAQPLE